MAKAVDGALGATVFHPSESLVGKHVRAQVGQLVTMSAQGLLRRKEANRSDPSRGGLGTIVRVNANWTCGERVCHACQSVHSVCPQEMQAAHILMACRRRPHLTRSDVTC